MKKYLFVIALLLTLSMTSDAAAQKHRHTPQADELVDSTSKDALEAFSDTTTVADSDSVAAADDFDEDFDVTISDDKLSDILRSIGLGNLVGGVFLFVLLPLILFVIAPVLILFLIFYFINRNRRDRMKLAQMAIEKGQPIPEQLLKDRMAPVDDRMMQQGIRQLFLGIGLAIFLGICIGEVGVGIGALIAFIGMGKICIAYLNNRKNRPVNDDDLNNDSNNTTDIQQL